MALINGLRTGCALDAVRIEVVPQLSASGGRAAGAPALGLPAGSTPPGAGLAPVFLKSVRPGAIYHPDVVY